ncbi:MAG: electron transfer flavoprotein subunit alpha [Angelakisella sp.]
MAKLKINHNIIDKSCADTLIGICPFSAISYENGKLDINAGCKMCGLCVKKGPTGAITLEQEAPVSTVNKDDWRGITVFVEHQNGVIHNVTKELIGKARQLASVTGHPVYALMLGSHVEKGAASLLRYGVDKVFTYDYPELEHFLIEPYVNAFQDFIEKIKPSSVLVGATNIGRSLAPRVAARFRTGLTADCTILQMKENTDLVQIRPAFGGNIMAQIVTPNNRPQFCTVRYKIFEAAKPVENPTGEVVKMTLAPERLATGVQLLSLEPKPKEADISEAEVIVAVGRGVKSTADMEMVRQLADLLGAQLACTRPLVEAGWFDAKHQIGLSGRTVHAKLIITVGISGLVQFAAGMNASECIVSINSDKDAPIFDIAHYGLVGDLYEILPQLIERCKEVVER